MCGESTPETGPQRDGAKLSLIGPPFSVVSYDRKDSDFRRSRHERRGARATPGGIPLMKSRIALIGLVSVFAAECAVKRQGYKPVRISAKTAAK